MCLFLKKAGGFVTSLGGRDDWAPLKTSILAVWCVKPLLSLRVQHDLSLRVQHDLRSSVL